jgi:hypothetical protein
MSRPGTHTPPHPEMVKAVDEMFKSLEQIATDPSTVGCCPQLPGIVLDKIEASSLDRDSDAYKKVTQEYEALRADYLKALVAHPLGRAFALLAVGAEGVEMMEQGRLPVEVTHTSHTADRPIRSARQSYNCHHIIPRSVDSAEKAQSINHPINFVVAQTTRHGRDQSQNPHHFWHSLLLHPQMHNAPSKSIPLYVVRPLFPFYPPISRGFRTAEELRKTLQELGAPPLPELWEKRVLEFSKAAKHRAYSVPKEFHEITQMFGDLYKTSNREPEANQEVRSVLAEKASKFAKEFLPAGAYVNGVPLPPDHRPAATLPIIESNLKIETSVQPARYRTARKASKPKISRTKTKKEQQSHATQRTVSARP